MHSAAAPDSAYYTRLGLAHDPFAVGAMPDFFFVGAQRRFIVQRAMHALYFSGATVLLLGADGIGKTRTLTEIEKELKDIADICHIEATVLMDATEVRSLLTIALVLPSTVATDNVELVQALEYLRPAEGDPQPVLVAIDAAQLLSIETLAECAALIAGSGGRLRLVLAGEADLAIAWQQTEVGAAEVLELKPLDRNEAEDYVRTKLQAAGYRQEQLLDDTKFDQLFVQTDGNFAAINACVPQFLQPAQNSTPVLRRIKALPILHIGVISALLAAVIVLVLYRSVDSHPASTASTQLVDSQKPQIPTPMHDVEQSTVTLQLPVAVPPSVSSDTASSFDKEIVAIPKQITVPVTTPSPIENKNEVLEKKDVVDKSSSALKKIVATKKEAEKKSDVAAKLTKPGDSSTAGTITLSVDERALLGFSSSHYVLQLMGAESKTTVDKFSKGIGKGIKIYYYRTQLRNKPWFIVVTGPYGDKNAALKALSKLPEAVRKQQPWPRTLVNVQADIRAHSGR